MSLWSYRAASEGEVGGYVPLAVMRDERKLEVNDSN